MMIEMGKRARLAADWLASAPSASKDAALECMAATLLARQEAILQANQQDLDAGERAGLSPALLDRLMLNPARLAGIEVMDLEKKLLVPSLDFSRGDDDAIKSLSRVAVQMGPMDGQMIDPDRASEYFQAFFNLQGGIDTFWGSVDEFMLKLAQKCATKGLLSID